MKLDPSKEYQTRDGRKVTIYCWDAPETRFPIHGRVEGSETAESWLADGSYIEGKNAPVDLIEVPPKPRVVWINEYPEKPHLRDFYNSKAAAQYASAPNRIRTLKFVEAMEDET